MTFAFDFDVDQHTNFHQQLSNIERSLPLQTYYPFLFMFPRFYARQSRTNSCAQGPPFEGSAQSDQAFCFDLLYAVNWIVVFFMFGEGEF